MGDSSTPGRVDGVPKFQRAGEPWLECPICGFDYPRSEMVRNYRTNKFVDMKCDDQLTHDDYLQIQQRRQERMEPTEQKVKSLNGRLYRDSK